MPPPCSGDLVPSSTPASCWPPRGVSFSQTQVGRRLHCSCNKQATFYKQHVQYDREHLQEHPTCHCYRIDAIIVLGYLLSPPILFIVSFHPPNIGPLLLVNSLLYRNSWLCLWFAVCLFLASRTTFVHRAASRRVQRHCTTHHSKREIRKTKM